MKNKMLKCFVGIFLSLLLIGTVIFFVNDKYNEKTLVTENADVSVGNVVVTDSVSIDSLNEIDSDSEGTLIDEEMNSPESEFKNYFVEGNFLEDGIVTDEEKKAMEINTRYLQKLVDEAKANQTIKLPAGVFYFISGGINSRGNENYVTKLNSNVHIEGAGINEEKADEYTVLKPYADKGTIEFGLDMFYWNEYADSNGKNPEYITNVSFSDFIIDGEDVRGNKYNSSGKGFMISLCKDCSWDNMVVRNTDATGFGMDNVINGSITNSTAINCGKNATTTSTGASGFGIGTGYSNEESMYIKNCKSIGNTKFGFFFEHQNRFGAEKHKATQSEGFVVSDSYASGNLYNFGGERANDVVYINCRSDRDNVTSDGTKVGYTKIDIYFSDESRRVGAIDFLTNNYFEDVTDSSKYYYDAVNWAVKNGYTNGVSFNKFGINEESSRADAIALLWRYAGRPGDVLTKKDLSSTSSDITNIKTGFSDVEGDAWFAGAIKWAVDMGITNGTYNGVFEPYSKITRADFIVMLWRYAGSPKVDTNISFNDVDSDAYYYEAIKWAYSKNIIKGVTETEFSPLAKCTGEQVVTILYRYKDTVGSTYSIRYLLFNGDGVKNKTSYVSGEDSFTLKNPTKEGYDFIGWTGSNGTVPEMRVVISKDDVGDKTYIANFKKSK